MRRRALRPRPPSLRNLADLGAKSYIPGRAPPGDMVRFADGSVYQVGHVGAPDSRGNQHWEGSELHFRRHER